MILLRNPEIALLLSFQSLMSLLHVSGRNLSLLWPRVEAWKPASPTVTQRKDSLCRKISWKQSDYNTRNDHFYPWFMMEVDLTRESLPWWDDRWQQSEQHWWCPLRVWNGRASNTGDPSSCLERQVEFLHAILNPALQFRVPRKILLQFCIVITLQRNYLCSWQTWEMGNF